MLFKVLRDWIKGTNKLERFWLLAKIEFKLRYYENILGLVWALIKPISDIVVYYVAFEVIMKAGTPQFVSFLFLGLILWNTFLESTTGTIQLLSTKKYLYEYTNMNKIEIYLSVIGSNLIGLFFNFCMFSIYYLVFEKGETHLTWHWVFMVPIILNLTILSLAFSMILSNLYILIKDISQIWVIVSGLAFWISPILFNPTIFKANLEKVEYINPFSSIVINARHVIMDHTRPEWKLFIWGFVYSAFLLLIGFYLLNKIGSKAAEKL
jgi:ABC-2 type transport system permease protein